MSAGNKAVLVVCAVLLAVGLVYRGNLAVVPARPNDMPEDARFLPSGYDLAHNERQGSWVSCDLGVRAGSRHCRVADAQGTVIFDGDFLPVRGSLSSSGSSGEMLAQGRLGFVIGPFEGYPVPVIPMTDGSMLVPRVDRDSLIGRWNADPAEWKQLQALQ